MTWRTQHCELVGFKHCSRILQPSFEVRNSRALAFSLPKAPLISRLRKRTGSEFLFFFSFTLFCGRIVKPHMIIFFPFIDFGCSAVFRVFINFFFLFNPVEFSAKPTPTSPRSFIRRSYKSLNSAQRFIQFSSSHDFANFANVLFY